MADDMGRSYLVINKDNDWRRGVCSATVHDNSGLSLMQNSGYERVNTLQFGSNVPELSGDFLISPGRCGILYILDIQTKYLGAYDYFHQRFIWIKSLGKICSNPTAFVFLRGTFYILDANHTQGPTVIAVAQINHQVRWKLGDKIVALENDGSQEILVNYTPLSITADEKHQLWILARYDQDVYGFMRLNASGKVERRHLADAQLAADAVFRVGGGYCYLASRSGDKLLKYAIDMDKAELIWNKSVVYAKAGSQPQKFLPQSLAVNSSGNLYLALDETRAINDEDNRFILQLETTNNFSRIFGYRGPVDALWFDTDDRLLILDQSTETITVLEVTTSFVSKGMFISDSMDSGLDGTLWHKLFIDADIPSATNYSIFYLASDSEVLDQNPGWQSMPRSNPRDALIKAQGRYLWLKIDMLGDSRQTPVIKSIRAYFPRTSYLDYLPVIYQENKDSRDFLEHFLSLFETFFSQTEETINRITRFFDVDAASGEFLPWLGSWLSVTAEENWDETRVRQLIKQAPGLYRQRGTREGILDLLEIYTDERPIIIENFQTYDAPDYMKDDIERLFGNDAYTFHVLFRPGVLDSDKLLGVERLLAAEKPAHTRVKVIPLQPWIQLGEHSYLGLNSYLNRPNPRLDVGSTISRDSVLTDIKEAGQVERRSRLGIDTLLT